jgi:hypothetical protein
MQVTYTNYFRMLLVPWIKIKIKAESAGKRIEFFIVHKVSVPPQSANGAACGGVPEIYFNYEWH